MDEVRVIITFNKAEQKEYVTFTDEMGADVNEFVAGGEELVSDQTIAWEEPTGFPMNSKLLNVH